MKNYKFEIIIGVFVVTCIAIVFAVFFTMEQKAELKMEISYKNSKMVTEIYLKRPSTNEFIKISSNDDFLLITTSSSKDEIIILNKKSPEKCILFYFYVGNLDRLFSEKRIYLKSTKIVTLNKEESKKLMKKWGMIPETSEKTKILL